MCSQFTTEIRQFVESDDPVLAERWYRTCTSLINPDQRADNSYRDEAVTGTRL
jgi:hypothetical protein